MRLALATCLAIFVAAPAWAARGFSVGAPYSYVQDRPFSPAESAKVIGGLKAAPGVTIRKRLIATIGGREMHAVTIEPARRPGLQPMRAGVAAGVHYEPEAIRVLHGLMARAAAGKAGYVSYTFYPIVNPSAQARHRRLNDQDLDVNRTFLPRKWSAEARAIREDTQGRHFDRFFDLHGSKEDGFFVIGDAGDTLPARAMKALPKWLRATENPVNPVYTLNEHGQATSTNEGTLRLFMASKGTRAYTVEYPRRASPRWQAQGMRRLVDSLIRTADADHRAGR